MPKKDDIAEERDAVMRQLINTPPKPLKDEPKRRPTPTPIGRLIRDAQDANKKRDKG